MTAPHDATLERFEDALAALDEAGYELTLFVSGASDLSARAIANARRLCDVHLDGRYHLSVVDVHEDPAAVLEQPGARDTHARPEPCRSRCAGSSATCPTPTRCSGRWTSRPHDRRRPIG